MLDFARIERQLTRRVGDADVAHAITEELRSHFAESVDARMELGDAPAEAIQAAGREILADRRLVGRLSAPYRRTEQRQMLATSATSIFVLWFLGWNLFMSPPPLGAVGGAAMYFVGVLTVVAAFRIAKCGYRHRRPPLLTPLMGAAIGTVAVTLLMATFWVPFPDGMGSGPPWLARDLFLRGPLPTRQEDQRINQIAAEGAMAFTNGPDAVPPQYRYQDKFLTPQFFSGETIYPLTDGQERPAPKLFPTSFAHARIGWQRFDRTSAQRTEALESSYRIAEEVRAGFSAPYADRLWATLPYVRVLGVDAMIFAWIAAQVGWLAGRARYRRLHTRQRQGA